jgi:GT2 family glycosyltransferase
VRSERRLLPHAARNLGAELARGELLVHADPDVYAKPDWLARMVAAHDLHGAVIAGAVGCHGSAWFDWAVHLSKYDSWLPGGRSGRAEIACTAGLLCPRVAHDAVGGFREQWWIGDTLFSWQVADLGYGIFLDADAVVDHHHVIGLSALLRERFHRGREFARLRVEYHGWTSARRLAVLGATVLPIRLPKLVARVVLHALRAGMAVRCLVGLPVIVAAQSSWLIGEATVYLAAGGRASEPSSGLRPSADSRA